jgi:hypothetical protein
VEVSLTGFSHIGNIGNGNIIEEPFDSGEEENFESIIEEYSEALPISEINPFAKVAVPIGRQVTVGNNSLISYSLMIPGACWPSNASLYRTQRHGARSLPS